MKISEACALDGGVLDQPAYMAVYEYIIFEIPIQEGSHDVHLVQFQVLKSNHGQQHPDGRKLNSWCKGLKFFEASNLPGAEGNNTGIGPLVFIRKTYMLRNTSIVNARYKCPRLASEQRRVLVSNGGRPHIHEGSVNGWLEGGSVSGS